MIKKDNFYENSSSEVDKTEQDVAKSIIEDKQRLVKTDKDFKNKTVQTAEKIKTENEKEKQEYLDLAAAYYAEDLKVVRENDKSQLQKVFSEPAGEKPKD